MVEHRIVTPVKVHVLEIYVTFESIYVTRMTQWYPIVISYLFSIIILIVCWSKYGTSRDGHVSDSIYVPSWICDELGCKN